MKLLSSYIKEMKIAARGFYFYIEIFMAVILLVLLLFAVKEDPVSKSKEFVFYDAPPQVVDNLFKKEIESGNLKFKGYERFDLKAASFEVIDETGIKTAYNFIDDTVTVDSYGQYDPNTGKFLNMVYLAHSEDDLIRLAYTEKQIGAIISMNDVGELSYRYYNQGYETERFINLLYVLHNDSTDALQTATDQQTVIKLGNMQALNNRENLIPIVVVFSGSLMGFFIVMAYIFLDKSEGVIRAFAVTPSSVWQYLLSKTLIIMTTVVVSASVITIPIMRGKPNYLLFYIFLLVTTFAFASLGLLVSSFFNNMQKAFGTLFMIMIGLMIPAFSYLIPSFDPLWLRFFPTYPMLQGFKEIIMINGDIDYVFIYTIVFSISGIILFLLSNLKFKKTLTV